MWKCYFMQTKKHLPYADRAPKQPLLSGPAGAAQAEDILCCQTGQGPPLQRISTRQEKLFSHGVPRPRMQGQAVLHDTVGLVTTAARRRVMVYTFLCTLATSQLSWPSATPGACHQRPQLWKGTRC